MTRSKPQPLIHDDIARRAYELFCERGSYDGDDLRDWFEAEQELAEAASARQTVEGGGHRRLRSVTPALPAHQVAHAR